MRWIGLLLACCIASPCSAKLAYHLRDGAGPSLLLIPGSFNDHRIFDRFLSTLPVGWRVVIVELPGHCSSPPAVNPTMRGFADDVLGVVETLKLRRFYVGGHSIGGMLAIEIAGRRPDQVAGVISMEGWTHHLVQAEAFGGDTRSTLTSEQHALRESHRARVRDKLTDAQIAAFASVWRKWDGQPILESTQVPVLEIWGDRGQPRPSRQLMRIPERPNVELAWMSGVSHPLLIECPAEVARATVDFVSRIEAARMFDVPEFNDFSRLPKLAAETFSIYRGIEGETGFNMHPYITFHDGRFHAMWSSNRIRDLQAGQYVRYATSADAVRWSESRALMPPEEKENFRYFARGFWIRNGELIALAARDEAVRPLFGPGLELRGYRWNGEQPFVVAPDTINNFPPEILPNGEWMIARRDHRMRMSMLTGGVRSPSDWRTVEWPKPADGASLDEPVWWTLPDGSLTAALRDGSKSRRLYRSFSRDGGRSWTPPARTDFPDATAKFHVLRLRSGKYVMASNPNPGGKRIPLCLSLSSDGVVFHRMAILRDAPTIYRYAGKDPGYAGYHYPQLLEHNGFLYVIHSENMEDIVLLRILLSAINRLGGW